MSWVLFCSLRVKKNGWRRVMANSSSDSVNFKMTQRWHKSDKEVTVANLEVTKKSANVPSVARFTMAIIRFGMGEGHTSHYNNLFVRMFLYSVRCFKLRFDLVCTPRFGAWKHNVCFPFFVPKSIKNCDLNMQ